MKYCHPLVRSIIFGQSYSQTGQSNGQNIKIRCNNVETAPTDATTLPQLRTWPNIRSEEIIAQTSTLLPLNKITLTVPTLRNHAITTHPFIPFARSAPFISSFYVYSRNGTFAYLNPETKLNRLPAPWISQWHWLRARSGIAQPRRWRIWGKMWNNGFGQAKRGLPGSPCRNRISCNILVIRSETYCF